MPQIKKIVIIGESRGITLPKPWLDFNEARYGKKLTHVRLQEFGQTLLIFPIPPSTKEKPKP